MFFKRPSEQELLTVNALPATPSIGRNGRVPKDKRSSTRVLVIDDTKLPAMEQLKRLGYDITRVRDIDNIDDLTPFDIILCDVMGVGKKLDPKAQGNVIIREAMLRYPNKFVIAYTGSSQTSPEATEARTQADSFLPKGAEIGKWQEVLDRYIIENGDPMNRWQRTRITLVEQGIDTYDLLRLENAFVRSLQNRDKSGAAVKEVAAQYLKNPLLRDIAIRAVVGILIAYAA